MTLFWHRRDLRVADNRGLVAAADAEDGPVVPLFVVDDDVLTFAGAPRLRFMLDALASLRARYRERGSELIVVRGDPATVVPAVATAHDVDGAVWSADYSGLARERDARVRRSLDDVDVAPQSVHDAVLHEPGSITTNDGEPYSVFTYFGRKWHDRETAEPVEALPAAELVDADDVRDDQLADADEFEMFHDDLPTIQELGFSEPAADVQDAGTEAARERLAAFLAVDVERYADARDYPAEAATSRLSADLKFGTIGIREVYDATAHAMERADDEAARESIREFQDQLAWREFYAQVLFHNPDVVVANYRAYERDIEWREDPEGLQAWKDGETGYPIVDAGMRQLRAEAFMHNRVRMIVASFLTKDLLIDWREGYAHFREHLVDHDAANDSGGWQWAASTGTDAQPYFRIFNPMTQGADYDPAAEYIAEHVPELRGVDPEHVHEWHELGPAERDEIAPEYPAPIVDHAERREAALAMFERARGEGD